MSTNKPMLEYRRGDSEEPPTSSLLQVFIASTLLFGLSSFVLYVALWVLFSFAASALGRVNAEWTHFAAALLAGAAGILLTFASVYGHWRRQRDWQKASLDKRVTHD